MVNSALFALYFSNINYLKIPIFPLYFRRFIPYEMLGIFELMEVKGYRMFHSERDFTNTFKITAAYIHESFLHDYMIHL